MSDEATLCVICAWRKDCQKKYLRSKDTSVRCSDFTKDITIKDGSIPNDKKEISGDHT